jgi:hypothetical protein
MTLLARAIQSLSMIPTSSKLSNLSLCVHWLLLHIPYLLDELGRPSR